MTLNNLPQSVGQSLRQKWRSLLVPTLVIVFVLVVAASSTTQFLPQGMRPEGMRLLAVTVLMAGLWVSQSIPLAATSLMPIFLFPLLSIQDAETVCGSYINDQVFLYLGGFVIALGIERWNLHRRIALNVVRIVGVGPKRIVLGFLIATGGLSMWISNTASTLLMLPIALALLQTLDESGNNNGQQDVDSPQQSSKLAAPLLLAIAYSASIGGLTTIIGTPTNNQAVGIYHRDFPDLPELSVAQWMMACLPIGLVYLAVTWYVLTRGLPSTSHADSEMKAELRERLKRLGKPSKAELRILTVFVLTGALWVFRKPITVGSQTLLPGWNQLMAGWFEFLSVSEVIAASPTSPGSFANDSTVSILMAVVLFFIPSGTRNAQGQSVALMDWPTASRLPWDIMLLFGGGFALAGAFGSTDLAQWLGGFMKQGLENKPMWLIIAVICLLMTFLTEFTSNVATVSTLMPTIGAISVGLGVDPRLLIVPATLATSCAFMLPIATPPNAIVFGSGRIDVRQMARYGIALNLLGVPLLTAATYLFIKPIMGIE
jgi:sodium-dependent dicarboxylate transporter 2/3/5